MRTPSLYKTSLIIMLATCINATSGVALAQLIPLSGGVADGEHTRHINSIFKEISSSPNGQAGKLVPSLLESLSGLERNNMYQVYQNLHPIMNDPSVIDALVQALSTSNAEMASNLLANCRNYGNVSMDFNAAQVQQILVALGSDNGDVRKNLAQVLHTVSLPSDSSVQTALIRLLLTDPQANVRSTAANSLGNIGREVYFKNAAPIAEAFGKSLSEDVSPQVRGAAASGLSQMGAKAEPAAAALTKALTDNSSQVRYQVLQSIINIGPACSACVDELIDMYNGPADLYRTVTKDRIVQALGAIGPAASKAVPLMVKMLKERNTAASAARALGNMGESALSAVPDLVRMLDSPFYQERDAAARALGSIGPRAKSALTALKKASNDDRTAEGSGSAMSSKQAAKEAIFKIEGGSFES